MRNGKITLSITEKGKSYPSPEIFRSQIGLLTLFAKIKFSWKFWDLQFLLRIYNHDNMSLVATKPVFRVSDKARLKPACSATETSKKIAILLIANLDMIVFRKRITKALISLRGCAGWSAPLLSANSRRLVFSRRGPYMIQNHKKQCYLVSLVLFLE